MENQRLQNKLIDLIYKVILLYKPQIDRWVIKAFIGAGFTIIISGFTGFTWYIAVLIKVIDVEAEKLLGRDYGFGVIEWKSVIFGVVLVLIGFAIYILNKRIANRIHAKPNLLIAILHKSIDDFLIPNYKSLRNGIYADYEIHEIELDQTKTYFDGSLQYPNFAIFEQKDLTSVIKTLVATNPNTEIAYFGLAHIPLLFYIGIQLADKFEIDFFEYNRETSSWDFFDDDSSKIKIIHNKETQQTDNSNGIIVVEISYNIDNHLVEEIVPEYCVKHTIRLGNISIDSITNKNEVIELTSLFRKCIDEILTDNPIVETIHIFYAGSVCLAVNLSRKISKRTDPSFIVYNYQRGETPKYKWGINLNHSITSEDLIIKN